MKPVKTYIISDLHFGHKRIAEFRQIFDSMEHHEQYICDTWQSTVQRDTDKVWILGDAAFNRDGLAKLGTLRGRKFLVRGNHDLCLIREYLDVFEEVYGIFKYRHKKYEAAWLSHAPIHPDELRGHINLHGHVHDATICVPGTFGPDPNYINCCPENLGYAPVELKTLLEEKSK